MYPMRCKRQRGGGEGIDQHVTAERGLAPSSGQAALDQRPQQAGSPTPPQLGRHLLHPVTIAASPSHLRQGCPAPCWMAGGEYCT